jgi:hypothetical protein
MLHRRIEAGQRCRGLWLDDRFPHVIPGKPANCFDRRPACKHQEFHVIGPILPQQRGSQKPSIVRSSGSTLRLKCSMYAVGFDDSACPRHALTIIVGLTSLTCYFNPANFPNPRIFVLA